MPGEAWGRPGRGLGESWVKLGRRLGEAWGEAWARRGRGLSEAWARPERGLGEAWARPERGLGEAWARPGEARLAQNQTRLTFWKPLLKNMNFRVQKWVPKMVSKLSVQALPKQLLEVSA